MARSKAVILVGVTVLLTIVALLAWAGIAQARVIERVSVADDEAQADKYSSSYLPAISGDGRVVAFVSSAPNLVPGDTNGSDDVFVRDLQTGATERVSVGTDGIQGVTIQARAVVSRSAATAATWSSSGRPISRPGNRRITTGVYIRDREAGTTERVALPSMAPRRATEVGAHPSAPTAGTWPICPHRPILLPGIQTASTTSLSATSQTGTTERVSLTADGQQANGAQLGLLRQRRRPLRGLPDPARAIWCPGTRTARTISSCATGRRGPRSG